MSETYLRLRWEEDANSLMTYLCHYELVIALDEIDIRREVWQDGKLVEKRKELVVPLSEAPLRRTGGGTPCINGDDGSYYYDRPYRDGAHAQWDSAKLGNIPVKVVAIDGTIIEKPENR